MWLHTKRLLPVLLAFNVVWLTTRASNFNALELKKVSYQLEIQGDPLLENSISDFLTAAAEDSTTSSESTQPSSADGDTESQAASTDESAEQSTPAAASESSPTNEHSQAAIEHTPVIISSLYGQRFVCRIPDLSAVLNADDDQPSEADDLSSLTIDNVTETLQKSFDVADCLHLNNGWWTYEYCFNGDRITQFHMHGEQKVGAELTLGRHSHFSPPDHVKDRKRGAAYLAQHFIDGSTCDLTGRPRKADVHFYCDTDMTDAEAMLSAVDELKTCEYVLTVHTGALCSLRPYRPPDDAPIAHNIDCRPLLTDDEMNVFNEEQQRLAQRERTPIEKEREKLKAELRQKHPNLSPQYRLTIERQIDAMSLEDLSDPNRMMRSTFGSTSFMGLTDDGQAVNLGQDPFGFGNIDKLFGDLLDSEAATKLKQKETSERPQLTRQDNVEEQPTSQEAADDQNNEGPSKLDNDDIWDKAEQKARLEKSEIVADLEQLLDVAHMEDELNQLIDEWRDEHERIRRKMVEFRHREHVGEQLQGVGLLRWSAGQLKLRAVAAVIDEYLAVNNQLAKFGILPSQLDSVLDEPDRWDAVVGLLEAQLQQLGPFEFSGAYSPDRVDSHFAPLDKMLEKMEKAKKSNAKLIAQRRQQLSRLRQLWIVRLHQTSKVYHEADVNFPGAPGEKDPRGLPLIKTSLYNMAEDGDLPQHWEVVNEDLEVHELVKPYVERLMNVRFNDNNGLYYARTANQLNRLRKLAVASASLAAAEADERQTLTDLSVFVRRKLTQIETADALLNSETSSARYASPVVPPEFEQRRYRWLDVQSKIISQDFERLVAEVEERLLFESLKYLFDEELFEEAWQGLGEDRTELKEDVLVALHKKYERLRTVVDYYIEKMDDNFVAQLMGNHKLTKLVLLTEMAEDGVVELMEEAGVGFDGLVAMALEELGIEDPAAAESTATTTAQPVVPNEDTSKAAADEAAATSDTAGAKKGLSVDVQDVNGQLQQSEAGKQQLSKTIAQLEEQLGAQLKQAGFDAEQPIQVKVLTTGWLDGEQTLTSAELAKFTKMIVGVLSGEGDQQAKEENYYLDQRRAYTFHLPEPKKKDEL